MWATLHSWFVLRPLADAWSRLLLWAGQRLGWLRYYGALRISGTDDRDVIPIFMALGPASRRMRPEWGATTFHEAVVVWHRWDSEAVDDARRERIMRHEAEHVRQRRRWGIYFLPAYGVCSLLAIPHCYAENAFEREARKAEWRII